VKAKLCRVQGRKGAAANEGRRTGGDMSTASTEEADEMPVCLLCSATVLRPCAPCLECGPIWPGGNAPLREQAWMQNVLFYEDEDDPDVRTRSKMAVRLTRRRSSPSTQAPEQQAGPPKRAKRWSVSLECQTGDTATRTPSPPPLLQGLSTTLMCRKGNVPGAISPSASAEPFEQGKLGLGLGLARRQGAPRPYSYGLEGPQDTYVVGRAAEIFSPDPRQRLQAATQR